MNILFIHLFKLPKPIFPHEDEVFCYSLFLLKLHHYVIVSGHTLSNQHLMHLLYITRQYILIRVSAHVSIISREWGNSAKSFGLLEIYQIILMSINSMLCRPLGHGTLGHCQRVYTASRLHNIEKCLESLTNLYALIRVVCLCVALTMTRGRGFETCPLAMHFWKSGFKFAFGRDKKR